MYEIKRGDSLSKIAAALKVKGGWQQLYQWNKKLIGSNPNRIFAGMKLTTGAPTAAASGSTKGTVQQDAKSVAKAPSQSQVDSVVGAIKDPSREDFIKRYGSVESLMPRAAFLQMADEQINPDFMRRANTEMYDFDRGISAVGGYRSGMADLTRRRMTQELERQRKDSADQYVGVQEQAFSNWYNNQMGNYMTSKAPSQFKLDQFGIPGPSGESVNVSTGNQYAYNPGFSVDKFFGGYGQYQTPPKQLYGSISPI